jgi:tryptophan halogenase
MQLPDSLLERIELYRATGRIRPKARELFSDLSWFYIFEGLAVEPSSYDPLVDGAGFVQVSALMEAMRTQVAQEVRQAHSHDSFFAPGSPYARSPPALAASGPSR